MSCFLDFFAPQVTDVCDRMLPDCGLGPAEATAALRNRVINSVCDFFKETPRRNGRSQLHPFGTHTVTIKSLRQNHYSNKARFTSISAQLGESLVPICLRRSNRYGHGERLTPEWGQTPRIPIMMSPRSLSIAVCHANQAQSAVITALREAIENAE